MLTCRCGNKAAIVDIDEDMNHKIIQVGGPRLLFQWPVRRDRKLCAATVACHHAVAGLHVQLVRLRYMMQYVSVSLGSRDVCAALNTLLAVWFAVQFDHAPPKGAGITEVKRTVPEYFL